MYLLNPKLQIEENLNSLFLNIYSLQNSITLQFHNTKDKI